MESNKNSASEINGLSDCAAPPPVPEGYVQLIGAQSLTEYQVEGSDLWLPIPVDRLIFIGNHFSGRINIR